MALMDQAAAAAAVAAPRANKRAKVVAEKEEEEYEPCRSPAPAKKVVRLTVWCKSLVFHGEGYAVFDDADGRMVFRVDSYYAGRRSMALMDHAGRVLLTVRRHCKVLSLTETWEVYKGDVDDDTNTTTSLDAATNGGQNEASRLMMRATKDLGNPSCTVSMLAAAAGGGGGGDEPPCSHGLYRMSWSRREEWSRVHRSSGCTNSSLVAEVRRKRGGPRKTTLLGKDVLSMTVQPGMDQAVAMAMLMISNSYR